MAPGIDASCVETTYRAMKAKYLASLPKVESTAVGILGE